MTNDDAIWVSDDDVYPENVEGPGYVVREPLPEPPPAPVAAPMQTPMCRDRQTLIALASPRPWSLKLGRSYPARIDIVDAKGNLVCHAHHISPKSESSPNWDVDMNLIVEIINKLRGIGDE